MVTGVGMSSLAVRASEVILVLRLRCERWYEETVADVARDFPGGLKLIHYKIVWKFIHTEHPANMW